MKPEPRFNVLYRIGTGEERLYAENQTAHEASVNVSSVLATCRTVSIRVVPTDFEKPVPAIDWPLILAFGIGVLAGGLWL